MKLVNNAKKFETNNEEVTSQEFSIGDPSVVIEILRNRLYKHKIRTLVQEYICNARDATREIKSTNPVEVTVPTILEPTFKVRDYGPGISPDRMSKVFIQYGSSTKRDSNNQVGGFGIGAKSAWSYTDSFNITTFIDGTKRTYIAHTGVNNNGRLDHIETTKTDEQNGTEIAIAVNPKDVSEFKRSVFRATFFWTENVKILGTTDIVKRIDGTKVSKTLELLSNEGLRPINPHYDLNNLIVIDGIVYSLTDDLADKVPNYSKLKTLLNSQSHLVFHVPNGFVEVSASREEISNSDYTQKNLKRLIDENYTKIYNELKAKFDVAKTTQEYLQIYMKLSEQYNVDCFSKTGDYEVKNGHVNSKILDSVKIERCSMMQSTIGGITKLKVYKTIYKNGYSRYGSSNNIRAEEFNHIFYYDTNDSMVKSNLRIEEYLKTNKNCVIISLKTDKVHTTSSATLLTTTVNKTYQSEFDQIVKDFQVKNLAKISYIEPVKVKKVKVPLEDKEFNLHYFDYESKKIRRITLAMNRQKYIYIEFDEKFKFETFFKNKDLNHFLNETKSDYKICGLSKENVLKVKKNANFISLETWIAKYKPSIEDVKHYLKPLINSDTNLISMLNKMGDLKDKSIKTSLELYKEIALHPNTKRYTIPESLQEIVKNDDLYKKSIDIDKKFGKLISDDYPLIEYISTISPKILEELKNYMNTKYELNRKRAKNV